MNLTSEYQALIQDLNTLLGVYSNTTEILLCKDHSNRGVAWSSGQHRSLSLQGSAVRISALPLSFISRKKNHKSTKVSRQEEKSRNMQDWSRRSGEKKRKSRQADQEWLRELVRFVS